MTMFVALNQNARLITIDQALRGLSCNCTCVCCGEAVIARKGMIREHHFAHHSNKESCFIQRESLLHLYAKEVICENLGLQLPPMPGVYPDSQDPTSWWDFIKVDQEVPKPGFQPDLVAHLNDDTELFIEVAVTSFIDEEKLQRIKAVGVKTIELDLSELLYSKLPVPSPEVKKLILEQTAYITWIYPEAPPRLLTSTTCGPELITCPPAKAPSSKCPEQRFTIKGMWVSAKILPTGSIAVRSWSYNPQITELLKSWRNQLGGEYNPKYKSWIFSPLAKEEVMVRLLALDEQH